jgi:translation initiation factor IF-3
MIMNEKIKAAEVLLTGVDGEDLGVIPTSKALQMAKELKVDLVCLSLMSSPPPCQLVRASAVKEKNQQDKKRAQPSKVKEIRLTPHIEEHDLETKKQQSQRILHAGDSVLLVVRIQGKEGVAAKKLLEQMIVDLKPVSRPKTGIQLSGKQAVIQLDPL